MAEGVVFDIQRFSVHDGPGIRTTVFLKGCPLACGWCHNPEGRDGRIQMRFFAAKCLGCGRCTGIAGMPPAGLAGKSAGIKERAAAEACPAGALTLSGKRYTSRQLMEIIERDRDFFGTQGGVTFSGGEPTAQADFLEEMLLLCRKHGIHAAIDTCGYASKEVYEKILPLCGLVLYDIKGIDSELHRHYTGKDNGLILDNFRFVARSGTPVWVRIPVIGGVNDNEDEIKKVFDFLLPFKAMIQRVTLIPYHSFGNTKYATIGLTPDIFSEIEDEKIQHYESYFAQQGFLVQR